MKQLEQLQKQEAKRGRLSRLGRDPKNLWKWGVPLVKIEIRK